MQPTLAAPAPTAPRIAAQTPAATAIDPPAWDGGARIEDWLKQNAGQPSAWHLEPCADETVGITQPEPGNVYVGRIGPRAPYASSPTVDLIEAHSLDMAALVALLSTPNSASTASTSALEGLVSKLSAMARAVRNRSYVLMAASISVVGAPAFLNSSSLRSKASVASFTDIASVSIFEIDHCGAAAQTPAPPTPTNAPAALPITIRFIEWRCGHHSQRPDDIPAASREQAQLILQAIGYAISQPGHARAAVFDDHSGTTVYLTDDYAEEIKPGWPSRTVLYHATPDQLAELRRPELARAWDDCYGGELREWDGAALLDDEMEWVTTQDVAAITQALTPVAWHEEGQRREVCQVPPVLKPAAELLAELREAARETAQYEADLAADRAAELEGGAS